MPIHSQRKPGWGETTEYHPPMSRVLALLIALSVCSAAPLLAQDATATTDSCYARPFSERAACIAKDLESLKTKLPKSFESLRGRLSPSSAADLSADQQAWQIWVQSVCPAQSENNTTCLDNRYSEREQQLTAGVHEINGALSFTRAHFRIVPGKPAQSLPVQGIDPGFGYGTLAWPQIDRPAPAQSRWNEAIRNKAAKLAVGFTQDRNATFDTAVNSSGTIDGFYTFEAINDRLIEVTLIDSTYGYGAAHPNTNSTAFLWWLDRNRELTADDVLLPASGWQQDLTPLTITRLQSNPDLRPMLWKGSELQDAVKQGIAAPASWTVTRDGLTITFGQYAVAAYAAGMPKAHFAWEELKPYLEPSLDPSTLPAPIPQKQP